MLEGRLSFPCRRSHVAASTFGRSNFSAARISMKSSLSSAILAFLLIVAASPLAAQEFSSLEERMTAAEFNATGLNKLSESELEALNVWLRSRDIAQQAGSPGEDRVGFRAADTAHGPIISRIEGEFTGWTGDTEFHLANGQVWKQTESTVMSVRLQDPVVEIRQGLFDAWFLRVEGHNKPARVIRIR